MVTFSRANRTLWVCFILLLIVFQTGCTAVTAEGDQGITAVGCIPSPLDISNPYKNDTGQGNNVNTFGQSIYADFVAGNASARNNALALLGVQTKKWANYEDIIIGDKVYRVTVIYLHPDLLRAIVLNHIISAGEISLSTPEAYFNNKVEQMLANIARREEMMFYFIVTPSSFTNGMPEGEQVTGLFKPSFFHLENTSREQLQPSHAEPTLDHPINLSSGYGSALAGYPLYISRGENICKPFIDPVFDTKLVMSVEGATIGATAITGLTFQVPIMAALPLPHNGTAFKPDVGAVLGDLPSRYDPKDKPPTPQIANGNPPTASSQFLFWIDTGRFVWYDLTQSAQLVDFGQP